MPPGSGVAAKRVGSARPSARQGGSQRGACNYPSSTASPSTHNPGVPKGAYSDKEKLAIEIVRQAEIARGWDPGSILGQHKQHQQGCDLMSSPPDGGQARPIEVKGWGEALLRADGVFTNPADVNADSWSGRGRIPPGS
jgi:hypothetical protein